MPSLVRAIVVAPIFLTSVIIELVRKVTRLERAATVRFCAPLLC